MSDPAPQAYLLSAVRTPTGRYRGGLRELSAPRLGSIAIREAVSRAGLKPTEIDELIFGNVVSAGVGQAPARQAALGAGLPPSLPALTINKVCGSGLKAVMLAAQAIRAGDARVIVAGGMESMSQAPHLLRNSRDGLGFGNQKFDDALLVDGLTCSTEQRSMGDVAEDLAAQLGISRADQDAWACESHRRAIAAAASGAFADELVPVSIARKHETLVVDKDEGPRADTTLATLGKLKPAFRDTGSVTAGNASQLSDGAAAIVVVDAATARASERGEVGRIVASHTSGLAPRDLFLAPVAAIQGALHKAGLTIDQIDLFEINEAFAVQTIADVRQLGLDPERVNVRGGAIALGHPLGASGARVLTTLWHALRQRDAQYGVAALCLGGGNAVALVLERVTLS